MTHTFNNEMAARFGVNAAVVADYIWTHTENVFSTEHSWFRYTQRMFTVDIPYLSERTVRRTLKRLTDGGVLKKKELNPCAYDRTLSYKFTEYGQSLMETYGDEPDGGCRCGENCKCKDGGEA